MISDSKKIKTIEVEFQSLKALVLRAMNKEMTPVDYKKLLSRLKPAMLGYQSPNDNTLLYWILMAAVKGEPQIFKDVWNLHKDKLSICDFRRRGGPSATLGSPHWLLALFASSEPMLYVEFLQTFGSKLTIEDFTQIIADPALPGNRCSILGLLAHTAIQNPEPFNLFWSTFAQAVDAQMLIKSDEVIAGKSAPPLASLCKAIKGNSFNCSILHYCLQQLGDLRPVDIPDAPLSGDIVEKMGDHVTLYNIRCLLTFKNKFFDALQNKPTDIIQLEARLRVAARQATLAGFHNAYFFLAQFYKQLEQDDKAHEVLKFLPVQSIYHDRGLATCIRWYLNRARVTKSEEIQYDYYYLAFHLALKISDNTKQAEQIQIIAYHFMLNGTATPESCQKPLSPMQVAAIQAKPDIDALLRLLKARKAAGIFNDIRDDIVQLPFVSTNAYIPAYASQLEKNHVNVTHEQIHPENVVLTDIRAYL